MKDLGAAKKILGMEITRDRSVGKLFLSQQTYAKKVLKHFNMNNAKPVTVPSDTSEDVLVSVSDDNDRGEEDVVEVVPRVLINVREGNKTIGSRIESGIGAAPGTLASVSILDVQIGVSDIRLNFNSQEILRIS
ncbi:hypothetical protein GH714_035051 [Hevea brasiliensis]|uniref:Reverse transcriptase Ty1/copia-type domain-containing protein n=1 Tax=Hevea brasiliensis TaxID=3981 RepID=A0A6A6NE77_HEVBR|nr:hypothetical protein GH714_035051 [Hevea brasiliensis]